MASKSNSICEPGTRALAAVQRLRRRSLPPESVGSDTQEAKAGSHSIITAFFLDVKNMKG